MQVEHQHSRFKKHDKKPLIVAIEKVRYTTLYILVLTYFYFLGS